MKKTKIITAAVLAAVVTMSPFIYAYNMASAMVAKPTTVTAPISDKDYQSIIDEANKTIEEYKAKADSARSQINSLNYEYDTIMAYIQELDQKQNEISEQISSISSKIDELNVKKRETEAKLREATNVMEEQYELMSERIQYVYENGETTYAEILFQSGDISDVLNRVEYVSEIAHYDDQLFANYQASVIEVAEYKDQLNIQLGAIAGVQDAYDAYQEYANELAAAKQKALDEVSAKIGTTEDLLSNYLSEIETGEYTVQQAEEAMKKEAEEAARKAKEAEEAKKRAAAAAAQNNSSAGGSSSGGGVSYNGWAGQAYNLSGELGALIWPCPSSHRISSNFGYRNAPTAGASSYHKGVDIPTSYGAQIIAAASGTVVAATYNSAMGNYVMIGHGGNDYTLYEHASSLAVTSGQTVTQGQVIAYVGSTGISTGNHLHFGVIDDGVYVNPLNYTH